MVKIQKSLLMDHKLEEDLRRYAYENRVSQNKVIEQALRKFFEGERIKWLKQQQA